MHVHAVQEGKRQSICRSSGYNASYHIRLLKRSFPFPDKAILSSFMASSNQLQFNGVASLPKQVTLAHWASGNTCMKLELAHHPRTAAKAASR